MSFTPHTVTAIYVIMALNLITQLSDGEPMGSVICRGPPLPLSRHMVQPTEKSMPLFERRKISVIMT